MLQIVRMEAGVTVGHTKEQYVGDASKLIIEESGVKHMSSDLASHSSNLSQSSQVGNRKRSFLDIIDNPLVKDGSPTKLLRQDSPIGSISSLLREGESGQSVPPQISATSNLISSVPINSELPSDAPNLNQQFPFPVAMMSATPLNSAPPLPPMNSIRSATNSTTPANQFGIGQSAPTANSLMSNIQLPQNLPQSLPSFTTLFGRNLLNNAVTTQSPRYASPSNQMPMLDPKTTYLYPGLDPYNPLRNSPPHFQGYALPQQQEPPGGTSRGLPADQQQQQQQQQGQTTSPPGIRFPLSDRINSLTTGGDQNRFVLLEQPNEIQRKSYKNESRYLLPNPLTICLRTPLANEKELPQILDGNVNVRIINADGNELPSNMQHILESLGGLTRPLDEERSASFSLKVSATSIGSMYRLLFTVNYRLKNSGAFTETIVSSPFSVCSNRKKQLKELKERLTQLQKKA